MSASETPAVLETDRELTPPPEGHEYVCVQSDDGQQVILLIPIGTNIEDLNVEELLNNDEQLNDSNAVDATSTAAGEHSNIVPLPQAAACASNSGSKPRILKQSSRPAINPNDPDKECYTLAPKADGKYELVKGSGLEAEFEEPLILVEMKGGKRARVQGQCACQQCGQTFVNQARLERHMAVHQVYGSYLCPLCGKTYKYEYNLFYHWRKTCREIADIVDIPARKAMDISALRDLVEQVERRKQELGPEAFHRQRAVQEKNAEKDKEANIPRTELPPMRQGQECVDCGLVVMSGHYNRHQQVHAGQVPPDSRSVSGAFYCDLCGLMFRSQANLMRHWRSGCPEIQVQLNPDADTVMDDSTLRQVITELLLAHNNTRNDKNTKATEASSTSITDSASADTTLDSERDSQPQAQGEAKPSKVIMGSVWADADALNAQDMNDSLSHQAPAAVPMPNMMMAGLTPRAKWSMAGGPVQCPECYRSFANAGRLERHLAGFHKQKGTHHCILCGNRFKYEYNLLYHYRHNCPYTKAYIDRPVRENMDAQGFRKMVHRLAQKEVHVTPSIISADRARHSQHNIEAQSNLADQKTMPNLHFGTGTGFACPACGIHFQSELTVQRHLRKAHADLLMETEQDDTLDVDGNDEHELYGTEGEHPQHLHSLPTTDKERVFTLYVGDHDQPLPPRLSDTRTTKRSAAHVDYDNEPLAKRMVHADREGQQPATSTSTDYYACEHCTRSFDTHLQLHTHMHNCHQHQRSLGSGSSRLNRGRVSEDRATCPLCDAQFRLQSALMVHWRSGKCSPLKQVLEEQTIDNQSMQSMSDQDLLLWINSMEVIRTDVTEDCGTETGADEPRLVDSPCTTTNDDDNTHINRATRQSPRTRTTNRQSVV